MAMPACNEDAGVHERQRRNDPEGSGGIFQITCHFEARTTPVTAAVTVARTPTTMKMSRAVVQLE
jgi:hypothetical protein